MKNRRITPEYDEQTKKNEIFIQEGILSKRIQKARKLFFYKTLYLKNNVDELTDGFAEKIISGKYFLIIGNEVKKIPSKLTEFVDYSYEKYVGKKVVLFYGNCHTGAVKRYLNTSKQFNEKYILYPLKEIQEVKDPLYFDLPVFQICDVFIHQSIWKKNRYGEKFASEYVISKLSAECQVIAMPNVYHLPCCLFPQYYEAKELRYKNRTYFFRDIIIDEGIKNKKTLYQIASEYYNYKFEHQRIRDQYCEFIETVKKREQDWDIKVSAFIESNIKKHRLFYEMNHPTNYLIKYYAMKILDILLDCEYSIGEVDDYKMDSYQMPFLPEIQEALGLQYSDLNQELRTSGVKIRNVKMDINEYVKQYFSTLWICGEFEKEIIIKSRTRYMLYKIESIVIKIFRKFFKILRKNKEEREK